MSLVSGLLNVASRVGVKNPKVMTRLAILVITGGVKHHRPRPWSMKSPYVSWPGLVDLTWIGRHQPNYSAPKLPAASDLVALFKRQTPLGPGQKELQESCPQGTTVLFSFVAQWFTDSFLRTYPSGARPGETDSNHQIDLVQVYGLNERKTNMLREKDNGQLTHRMAVEQRHGQDWLPLLFERSASGQIDFRDPFKGIGLGPNGTNEPLHDLDRIRNSVATAMQLPANDRRVEDRLLTFHATGLDNGNGTAGYTAVNTLFVRAHNVIADSLWNDYQGHVGWDQERVFQTTRCILIAMLIRVIFGDYISHIANEQYTLLPGHAEKKKWNQPNRIAIEFNFLYRWHSMIPNEINFGSVMMNDKQYRNHPDLVERQDLRDVITSLSNQTAGRISLYNTPGFMFSPAGSGAVDGTIAATRRAQLPMLNDYCEQFGVSKFKSIEDLVGKQPNADKIVDALHSIYPGGIDDVELFPGLFAEKHDGKVIMGKLMKHMVAYDAFTQLLTNPLVSGNIYNQDTFTPKWMKKIEKVNKFKDIAELALNETNLDCSLGKRS